MAELSNVPIGPPESLNLQGWRPTSDNIIIRTFAEPFLIKKFQEKLSKAWHSRNEIEHLRRIGQYLGDEAIEGLESGNLEEQYPYIRSWFFGTPVLDYVAMFYDDYTNDDGVTVPAGGIMIQNILLTVRQTKNIVKTVVPGRSGTIKQFVSNGDYVIEGTGKIVAPPNELDHSYASDDNNETEPLGLFVPGRRPVEELGQFVKVLDAQLEVDVYSPFLNLWNITTCVLERYELPQEKGIIDNQYFKFTMSSDEPFEVEINDA